MLLIAAQLKIKESKAAEAQIPRLGSEVLIKIHKTESKFLLYSKTRLQTLVKRLKLLKIQC